MAPVSTIAIPPVVDLPHTGGPAGGAIAAFGASLIGLGVAARRFSRLAL